MIEQARRLAPRFAARAAASRSSSVAPGLPYRRFRRIVSWNRYDSWVTTPISSPSDSSRSDRTSCPSIRTAPSPTSYNRGIRYVTVVLPAPDGPTRAASWPGRTRRETSSIVHARAGPLTRSVGDTGASSGGGVS